MEKTKMNLKRKQPKKKVSLLILIILSLAVSHTKLYSQNFNIYIKRTDPCKNADPYFTYFGIPNKLVLSSIGDINLKQFTLRSDSGTITRLNDSIFLLKPKIPDLSYKIYVIDTASKLTVAAVSTTSISSFLNVTIFDETFRQGSVYNFQETFKKLNRLRFQNIICFNPDDFFKIQSFNINLERDSKNIFSKHFRKNKISNASIKWILENAKIGDQLTITQIKVKKNDGSIVNGNDYKLSIRNH